MYRDLFTEYGAINKLEHSFQQGVVSYIERCRLEDGGYFFARVLPSSGMDTYCAVKSLFLLGIKPDRSEDVAGFFLNQTEDGSLGGITGLFYAVEVLHELGQITDEFRNYAGSQLCPLQNKAGGFGAYENVDVEVPSELQDTYRAVRTLNIIKRDLDREKVGRFVAGFLNPDGGYGSKGYSTLSSTFYATAIYRLLRLHNLGMTATKGYLRRREQYWQVQFIEDLYWLVEGLANLSEKPIYPDRFTMFVLECQRHNGGFSRATIMGIPTLEYTYYAISILKKTGALHFSPEQER